MIAEKTENAVGVPVKIKIKEVRWSACKRRDLEVPVTGVVVEATHSGAIVRVGESGFHNRSWNEIEIIGGGI